MVESFEPASLDPAAKAELDQWDEPSFGRFGATFERHYPGAGTYVFNDLSASTGDAAVHGVATFLTRIDALEAQTQQLNQAIVERDDVISAQRTRLDEVRGRVQVAMKQLGTWTASCRARNSDGEHPTIVVKVRLNVPRLANPTSHATSVTGRSV